MTIRRRKRNRDWRWWVSNARRPWCSSAWKIVTDGEWVG